MQFLTKKNKEIDMQIAFANKHITNIYCTKFLGLTIHTFISWEDHIKELTNKLNKACYAIRSIKPLVSLNVLRMICFCYVHSIISYGIIFLGNSDHSKCIFIIQKRIIGVIVNTNQRDTCHELFKQLNILPLQSQYILSVLIFINKNRDPFISNLEMHGISTRFNSDLHLPLTILTLCQKGFFYSGSRIFNQLLPNIKDLFNNRKRFTSAVKKYLLENCYCTLEEYFNSNANDPGF